MKHSGKPGKRSGPTGYRTSSKFLHRKCVDTGRVKAKQPRKFSQK